MCNNSAVKLSTGRNKKPRAVGWGRGIEKISSHTPLIDYKRRGQTYKRRRRRSSEGGGERRKSAAEHKKVPRGKSYCEAPWPQLEEKKIASIGGSGIPRTCKKGKEGEVMQRRKKKGQIGRRGPKRGPAREKKPLGQGSSKIGGKKNMDAGLVKIYITEKRRKGNGTGEESP